MKIKKGDKVKVISGKDKGRDGKVAQILKEEQKIVVDGLNIIKKHIRPKKEGEKGERVEISAPMAISNVMLICPHCAKTTRIGYLLNKEKKSRKCKKCGKEID